jgi:steroid 5-alpha reductase family enzyme
VTDGFFINLHKVLVIPVVLLLMLRFHNTSVEMWIYLALHGTYALLWLLKQTWYPDARFSVRRPIWQGVLFVFLPLAGYYIAPYLLASSHASLPPPLIAAAISLYTFGIFFHYVGDAQKYFTLRAKPQLIEDGLFSRTRNPNYFGEICIYLAFAILSAHLLPFFIVGAWTALFFIPGIRQKDKSLARYPDYASYKLRTSALIPRFWGRARA